MEGSSSTVMVGNTVQAGHLYKAAYDKMLGNTTQCAKVANLISNCVLLAVFVLGCIGPANIISGSVMGWIIVGLGTGYILIKLLPGNISSRKVDLIISAAIAAVIMTFGALGCAGVLASTYMGYALIGSVVIIACLSSYLMISAKRRQDIYPNNLKNWIWADAKTPAIDRL